MDLEKMTDDELREECDTRRRAHAAAGRNYMQRMEESYEADREYDRRQRKWHKEWMREHAPISSNYGAASALGCRPWVATSPPTIAPTPPNRPSSSPSRSPDPP